MVHLDSVRYSQPNSHPLETNVKRVALPAELVARIRAGESVSADEITAAQERVLKPLPHEPENNDFYLRPPPVPAKRCLQAGEIRNSSFLLETINFYYPCYIRWRWRRCS